MARRGENIYRRKDGRWEGRYIKGYSPEGRIYYGYVYGKSYAAAKQLLLDRQTSAVINSGSPPHISSTYEDILNAWLETQRLKTKESTHARYYQVIKTHIIPALGGLKIDKISTQLIERYIGQLIDSGRLDGGGGLSAKSVSDILTIIKSTIAYAKYNGHPVSCNLGKLCVKRQREDIRVLSVPEQQKLTAVLLKQTDPVKFGILLSLYTGVRLGEVCALKWENIDMEGGILSIRETMQRIRDITNHSTNKTKIVITKPKSICSIRDIPLPTFLAEIAGNFPIHPKEFILTGQQDKFIEPRTMQNRFKRIIEESGINKSNYHCLRHTFATRCVEAGFDIKTLSEILGHANVNITLNRYIHSSFELKRENMKKLCCIASL